MWSTGDFIKLMKPNGTSPEGFTAAWAERTALYTSDIETLSAKKVEGNHFGCLENC